jgi:hypothetical protein
MSMLDHPDVVSLKHCFYSKGDKVRLSAWLACHYHTASHAHVH